MSEQRFVDRILALDGQHRDPPKTELLVQPDGGGVVVCHRQIHVRATAVPEARGQGAGQRLADAGQAGRRVDGKRPQAGAVLGITEQPLVVDAGDGAHHRPVFVAHRNEVGDLIGVLVVVPDPVVAAAGALPTQHLGTPTGFVNRLCRTPA